MKKVLVLFVFTALLLLEQACYKVVHRSFIHNESGQSVKVSYTLREEESVYYLAPHQSVEIPDIDHWDLTTRPELEVVYFDYADSTRVVHECNFILHEDGTGEYVFSPAENNILLDNLDQSSWKMSHQPHNVIFYDYYIR